MKNSFQVSRPLLAFTFTPGGPDTRLKLKLLAGRSESLAVSVSASALCSLIVWSAMAVSTGALFTSLTVTMKLRVAVSPGEPLSVTCTVSW